MHNVSSEQKNAEHLKSLILSEFENLEKEYRLQIIGLCTDASGESQAARLHILAEMPWLLVADCWAHQVFYSLSITVVALFKICRFSLSLEII